MAINRYQKFLFSIELNGKEGKDRQAGIKPANAGWSRESPRVTSPYVAISANVPTKISRADTKEDRQTPAGTYYERDLQLIQSQIISAPARFTARRRGSGQ